MTDKEYNDKLDSFALAAFKALWESPNTTGWGMGDIARQAYNGAAAAMICREDHTRGKK